MARQLQGWRMAAVRKTMYPTVAPVTATLALPLSHPSLTRPTVSTLVGELSRARVQRHLQSVLLTADEAGVYGIGGSQMAKVGRMDADARGKHYQELTNLMVGLGAPEGSSTPAVVALDGMLCGAAAGAALHAPFFVVTERTRLWLPGPAYGCPTESLALHRISRLPHGIGRYLALTGAALSGAECKSLGLATHLTESHALPLVTGALGEGLIYNPNLASGDPYGRLSRRITEACIDPPALSAWGPEHALYYAPMIEETFTKATLPEILRALAEGATEWHAAVLDAMKASSPLALSVTFAQLQFAAESNCWAEAARAEAESCSAAANTADFRAGASHLEKAKRVLLAQLEQESRRERVGESAADVARRARTRARVEGAREAEEEIPVWEHASVEAVPQELVAKIVAPMV